MAGCEPTQSYKIPLKACQNSVIDHNLVTIRLSVEWPEKGGDDPNLVVDITNKLPSTPYFQQNHSSILVNPLHHHHLESVGSTYQQQYYHSPVINNPDLSNSTVASTIGDHDDVSSTTTTTVVYNRIEPQLRRSTSPLAIQKIEADLKSQFQTMGRRQPPLNQQYLSSQHVIQTPSTNMNDSRLDMKMSTISPTTSIKPMPSVIIPYFDLQQPSTMTCSPSTLNTSSFKSLICNCPNPTNEHVQSCAIHTAHNQESNTNFPPESTRRLPMNRTHIQRAVSGPQAHMNCAISIPPKEPMTTRSLMPFPNPNLMKTLDSSSSVTTIISQPSSFLNNNPIGPTIKFPSLNTDINFQPPSLNLSHVIINNQPNFPTNPSMSIPTVRQQNTDSNNSRQRKQRSIKRNNLPNLDQTSFQNQNNSRQQDQFINNQNPPTTQQNINSPSLLSSPIEKQQGMFMLQNNSQITDKSLCGSKNDIKVNAAQQQSPRTNSNIRSPVELDIPISQNLNQTEVSAEAMEKIISDVANGKGNISIDNSSTSPASQKQQKQPVSSQLAWESNGPITTTRTYLSSLHQKQQPSTYDSNVSTLSRQNVIDITQQVIRPNLTAPSQMNILLAPNNSKKRNRSKPTNNSQSKRTYKPKTKVRQQTKIISSVTSTSNLSNKQSPWANTDIPSSSSGNVTIASSGNSNQHLTNHSLQMPGIDHDSAIIHYLDSNEEPIQIIYPNQHHEIVLDEIFSSKMDEFDSSTPPPPPLSSASITSPILNSASAEKSSNTVLPSMANPDDVYEDFFPSHILSVPSTWEENQVTSSVITPPDPQNKHLSQQQHSYSQIDTYFDSNLQSQTPTPQIIETNSKTVKQMNNNDVQTSSKPQQQQRKTSEKTNHQSKSINNKSSKRPSKLSKQRNRPNSLPKQSSTKPICTRCGLAQLTDITHHEFPKQKGLVFECVSCGNSSIRSNVSADERKRRLAKVAADHLHTVECQFCHRIFHSHNEYLTHLRDDHGSNKPM